ncbi:MAG: tetratricopeptide repeat protein [Candidatus Brocadiae bacterium]|nr:tetratricopeptide repeat protein [Candidatus Brocadiia bacterium]
MIKSLYPLYQKLFSSKQDKANPSEIQSAAPISIEKKEILLDKLKIHELWESACVQGESFSQKILFKTQSQLDTEEALASFLQAEEKNGTLEKVEETEAFYADVLGTVYAFRNTREREDLYKRLDEGKKANIHSLVGKALQELFPNPNRKILLKMVSHWIGAGDCVQIVLCYYRLTKIRKKLTQNTFFYAHRGLIFFQQIANPDAEQKKILVEFYIIQGIEFFRQGNKDSSLQKYNHAFEIAQEIAYEDGLVRLLYHQGQWEIKWGSISKAQELWLKGLEKEKSDRKKMPFYYAIGKLFLLKLDLIKAPKNILKGLSIAREKDSFLWEQKFLHLLGMFHKKEGNWNLAQDQYQKSFALAEAKGSKKGKAKSLLLQAFLSYQQGRWKECEFKLLESKELISYLKNRQLEDKIFALLSKLETQKGERKRAKTEKSLYIIKKGEKSSLEDKEDPRIEEYITHSSKPTLSLLKLARHCIQLGDWSQAEKFFAKALDSCKKLSNSLQESLVWKKKGDFFLVQYSLEEAQSCYQKSMAIKKEIYDFVGESIVWQLLARIAFYQGNPKEANDFLQRAFKIQKKLGMTGHQGNIILSMGDILSKQENYDEAIKQYESAYTIYKNCNFLKGAARAKERLGFIAMKRQQWEKALENFLYSLEVCKIQENKKGMGRLFLRLGQLYDRKENSSRALSYFQKALAMYQGIKNNLGCASAFHAIARWHAYYGDASEALSFFQNALEKSHESRNVFVRGSIHYSLGKLFFRQKKLLKAMENFAQSLSLREKIHAFYSMGLTYQGIAKTYLNFHRPDKGILNLQKAYECWEKFPDKGRTSKLCLQIAKLCTQDGKQEEGKEYYKKALEFYKKQNPFLSAMIESEIESLD